MDVNSDMYGSEKNIFTDSSYQVTDNQSIPVYADVQTYPCSNCGRCFHVESLVNNRILHASFHCFSLEKTSTNL